MTCGSKDKIIPGGQPTRLQAPTLHSDSGERSLTCESNLERSDLRKERERLDKLFLNKEYLNVDLGEKNTSPEYWNEETELTCMDHYNAKLLIYKK